jgi:rare lipoprotein A (peptidoglycan hydrolase)
MKYLLVAFGLVFSSQVYAHNASVFCDRVTATGGMNCGAMQFAHRTLPLGSTHRLCSSRGCVNAKVVDRGPAKWTGRTFDLSPGLARALGVNGLGNVTVR